MAVRESGGTPEAWRPASGAELAGGVGVGLALHRSIISGELEDLRILGDRVVNGISSVHLTGLRSTKNSFRTPSMSESLELPSGIAFTVDLFISKNDYYLVRFRWESVPDPTGHFVVVDFYDYNESIFIEFPEL